ncbi:MAG TPA: TPM domain-containing protein [Chitinophagaceae bacterium]|nr:TPM domain-containing protein [Chitinophagaceae bacterium]
MKKLLLPILLLLSITGIAQEIQPRPNPPRLVNDFAHVLTPDQIATLEQKLVDYDDSTSTQVAVITIQTTGDYDIQQVALAYLREWGIGNAKTNNGIVLLAAIQDRKIRIETGYGMEGAIPDITAKAIIDNEIAPNFKAGNYYRGFDEATNAIIKAAEGEYKAPEGYNKKRKSGGRGSALIIIIIMVILVFMMSGRGGGGGGNLLSGILLGSMLSGGRGSRGSWVGGGWSGGGGGGFGGFGGGSGGGGGASGSW